MSARVCQTTGLSADNATAVTVTLPTDPQGLPVCTKHWIKITATGTPLAGTGAIKLDGVAVADSVTFTAGLVKVYEGAISSITVTPSSLTAGCKVSVNVKSWVG